MSKESADEALSIAQEIDDQLKFYREIGFEDIGGSARVKTAPTARSTESRSTRLQSDYGIGQASVTTALPQVQHESASNHPSQTLEVGLFGEIGVPPRPGVAGLNRAGLPILDSRDPSLEGIREDIGDCHRCRLHEHRRTIVFGEGDPQARLVFIGEGPGAEEDASGRPFVGRAGQLLDKIIAAIGLKREEVYIANIVKCRPPGNRTPERDEVDTCEQFVFRQLAFIRPEVVVALGSPAFQCLMKTREPITRARGQWRDWNGIRLMPTFHPAFLLRSPDKKREVWDDMKKVRDYLNDSASRETL